MRVATLEGKIQWGNTPVLGGRRLDEQRVRQSHTLAPSHLCSKLSQETLRNPRAT